MHYPFFMESDLFEEPAYSSISTTADGATPNGSATIGSTAADGTDAKSSIQNAR
jgi:hypothetical protein